MQFLSMILLARRPYPELSSNEVSTATLSRSPIGVSRFNCVHLQRSSDILVQHTFLGDTPLKVL
jgi:hypothetical protein